MARLPTWSKITQKSEERIRNNPSIKFKTEAEAKKFYTQMKGLQSKYSRISYHRVGKTVVRY
jgi:hypothetical protein